MSASTQQSSRGSVREVYAASKLRRPEILAPAGSEEAFAAALASGADAVYLGLSAGFNARARGAGFDVET